MKKREMEEIIQEELSHIPKEDLNQNLLRMSYNGMRESSLAGNIPERTKEEVLIKCIQMIKKDNPDFKASYDYEYFKI